MTDSASGCAVGPDGSLLDASQIKWFHDADDALPFAPASSSPSSGDKASTSSEAGVHPLFRRRPAATLKVAGARRSARALRPSARMIDPDNAEASTSAGQKRSRKASIPTRRTSRKVIESDTEPASERSGTPIATDAGEETEPGAAEDYAKLQLMADADHEVCRFLFQLIIIVDCF
jgi:hypothetical protein